MPSTAPEHVNPQHLVNEIVRAGAGAGKTYALTHHVMDVAEEFRALHGHFPRVVVTTFTRKATQELRERLMLLALDEKPELIDFVNSRSQLVVSTIHGVMDLFLKRYGGNINIDPSYKVVSSQDAEKLARSTLRQVLFEDELSARLLDGFRFNELTALMRRLDGIFTENADAKPFSESEFAKLFSDVALDLARELMEAAEAIQHESTNASWLEMADGYNKVAKLLLKGDWINNRDAVLNELEEIKTARRNAKNPPVSDETADEAEVVRGKAKRLRDVKTAHLFDPAVWREFSDGFASIEKLARRFSEAFRNAKLQQGLLEISDLETLAMDCIRRTPEAAAAFSAEWDYWLIDEYQDTSPFQVELLRKLTGDRPAFIVGDPQQSIYLFRGARSEVFAKKEIEFAALGAKQRFLTMNRRSRPEFLLFLNDFFERFDPPFQKMEPHMKEGAVTDPSLIACRIYAADAPVKDSARRDYERGEENDDDILEESGVAEKEMLAIVTHVQSLLRDEGVAPEDICVLARTNRTLMEVATWLGRFGLPTHVHAASGFLGRRETRDALALLKFLINPHDGFNLVELLRSPWFRVPDLTLTQTAARKPASLWNALNASGSKMNSAGDMSAVSRLRGLLELTGKESLSGAFRRALVDCGFIDFSHTHDVSGRRESNIWKLLHLLETEERRAGFNPLAFVNGSSAELDMREGSNEGDAVAAVEPNRINLMTIHASKGLEFRHVILPRLEQKPRVTASEKFTFDEDRGLWAARVPFGENGDLTSSLAERAWLEKFSIQELHEHARVLYVALTRAVDSVYLSWTGVPKRNSWAEQIMSTGLFSSEPGLHAKTNYSYFICSGDIQPAASSRTDERGVVPRAKWAGKKTAEHELQSLSVTEILDRQNTPPTAKAGNQDVAHRLRIASDGTAVHKLMELLKYPSRDRIELLISKWFPDREDKVMSAIDFVRHLEAPPLLQIIANGEVEWGFAITLNGILIEGQVDLWGRTEAGDAWIIDYKTGNPESREKAFEQMSLYAVALRKSGLVMKDEKISLAAIYPFARKAYIENERPLAEVLKKLGIG